MIVRSDRWDDLLIRIASGMAIGVVCLSAVALGGLFFLALIVAIASVITWELVRMLDPEAPAVLLAAVAGGALCVATLVPVGFALPLLIGPAFVGLGQMRRHRTTYGMFVMTILLAGFGLWVLRDDFGLVWMLWLALVVGATDVFGYLAGRLIGGPKFWPRVSPKKTWAGTIAGWISAAVVAFFFIEFTDAHAQLIGISVAVSMASQFGDIMELALKRRMGVKDSSSLLPGHGGLFDRFDGMLGASVFLLLVEQLVDFPPGIV